MPEILAEIIGELGGFAIVIAAMLLLAMVGLIFEGAAALIRNRKAAR